MYGKKFAKLTFAESLQWPACNYLLCNTKDSSRCNYYNPILHSNDHRAQSDHCIRSTVHYIV